MGIQRTSSQIFSTFAPGTSGAAPAPLPLPLPPLKAFTHTYSHTADVQLSNLKDCERRGVHTLGLSRVFG